MSDRSESALQLVDALMRVPVLDTLRTRRLCIEMTGDRLRQRVSVPDFEDKKPHLLVMVKAFSMVSDGRRRLVDTVHFLADGDVWSTHAAALVEPLVDSPLEAAARDELWRLIQGLDRARVPGLPTLFAAAAGETFGPLPDDVMTVWEAYQLLEQYNVPADGVPRTVRFVQALAQAIGPERGDSLRNWLSRTVRATQPDPKKAREVLDASRRGTFVREKEPSSVAYLLIRLRRSTDAPDMIWLTCWTSRGSTWQPQQRDDRYLPMADVPSHVAKLIDDEEKRLHDHQGGLVLEFILPIGLMNLAVEDWTRAKLFGDPAWGEPSAPPLGLEYRVVLRSLERIETLEWHRVWNERWRVLTNGDGGRVHRCEKGEGARHGELKTRVWHDPAIVVMALGSPPDDEHGRRELALGIRAGLPVLVWSHEGPLGDDVHAATDRITAPGGWDTFLAEVGRLRFAPSSRDDSSENSVGSRMAVLWDDPDRLPEFPEVAG